MARSIFRANVLWRRRFPGGRYRNVARELLWNGGVLFSAFGQPGSIARFCVIWPNVTSLQLIYVASPDWTSQNHTHVDTAGPKTFDNNGRHPSSVAITSWSKIKGIAWITDLIRKWRLLRLGSFFRLFALCSVSRWAGEGNRVSILVRILASTRLIKECAGNFSGRPAAHLFGALANFFNACLKVCTKRSAAPLVAGWYGAPVRWSVPFSLQNSWNSSD